MAESFKCAYDEIISLSKLVPNPRNANNHPQSQIEILAKIIDFQGQRSPIVVSKRSGFIVKGHGRLLALMRLGWQNAAVDLQDYESEAQEFADMIADNEVAKWSEFDSIKMVQDLKTLEFQDIDLLGIKDFSLDLPDAEFNPLAEDKETPKKQCPHCGENL